MCCASSGLVRHLSTGSISSLKDERGSRRVSWRDASSGEETGSVKQRGQLQENRTRRPRSCRRATPARSARTTRCPGLVAGLGMEADGGFVYGVPARRRTGPDRGSERRGPPALRPDRLSGAACLSSRWHVSDRRALLPLACESI